MGDAFNMRHPLTGGGMTVALSDIVVLRNLLRPLRDLNDAPSLCKYLESFYTLRKVILRQPPLHAIFPPLNEKRVNVYEATWFSLLPKVNMSICSLWHPL